MFNRLPRNLQIILNYLLDEAPQWLPKSGLWRPLVVAAFALQMAACKPTVGLEPTPTPTLTPTPTPTLEPTPTLTPTPTPIPTLSPERVGGVEGIPDPKETNPELFDLVSPYAPIPQFVRAMETGGIEVNPQEVVANLQYQPITGVDGKQYIIGTYNLDPNPKKSGETLEGPIPLIIGKKKEWGWKWEEITRSQLASLSGSKVSTMVEGWRIYQGRNSRLTEIYLKDANVHNHDLFGIWDVMEEKQGKFSKEHKKAIYGLDFSITNGKEIEMGFVFWGLPDRIPNWVKEKMATGTWTIDDLIAYRTNSFLSVEAGRANIIVVINEALPHNLGIPNYYLNYLTREEFIEKTFLKIKEARPQARLAIRDFSIEFDYESNTNEKSDMMYSIVRDINERYRQAKGTNLINVVEFQLPLLLPDLIGKDPNMDPNNFLGDKLSISMDRLSKNIKRFREIGVDVRITEFFVPIDLLGRKREEQLRNQARIYYYVFNTALEAGAEVGTYLPWDADDPYTYPPYDKNTLPYPRDSNFNPLPSHYAINSALFRRILSLQ